MDTSVFLTKLIAHFEKVSLHPNQEIEYLDRINRIEFGKRKAWYDAVIENCRRFPSIAELMSVAKESGSFDRALTAQPHHDWIPTDCWACKGSGMVLSLWSTDFIELDSQLVQQMRLMKLAPYLEGTQMQRENPEWHTAIFRCSCDAGDARGLPKWPRWSDEQPTLRRRAM